MTTIFNTQDLPPVNAPQIEGWEFHYGLEEDFGRYLSIFRDYIDENCGTLALSYNSWLNKNGALIYYTSGDNNIGIALIDRRRSHKPSIRLSSFSSSMEDAEIVNFLELFLNNLNTPISFSSLQNDGRYHIFSELATRLELKPISHYRGQFDYWRST